LAQAEAVFALVDRGAVIYVCGDGSKMEPGVKRALIDIRRRRSDGDEAAEHWMDEMGRQNRYVLDVWASG
jgi:cytochrome P450 / NADPH-cytochrome P450 reductase